MQNRKDIWVYFKNLQNIFDLISIFFSLFYFILRMVHPKTLVLDPEEVNPDVDELSLVSFLMITFAFAQWIDYLKTTDFLNKYLSLLVRALWDMGSFLVIFALF